MANKLTDEKLAGIKRRVDNASVGWVNVDGIYVVSIDDYGNDIIIAECDSEDNAFFIGEARQDVPTLLAEIERLQTELGVVNWKVEKIRKAKDRTIRELRRGVK